MTPPWLRVVPGGVELSLKVQPRARRNEIGEALGHELKVKITAPPVDSAANEALVEFLAETLSVPRGTVKLLRGQTSRHKVVFVANVPAALVAARLIGDGTNGA
jgi:uncharacterized protein